MLKGGTLLQHRLGLESRATKDLDGIVRGDIDDFLAGLDARMGEDWGPISFSRSEVETIDVPVKSVKPRSFKLSLSLRGKVWRNVKVEISPDEGMTGSKRLNKPSLQKWRRYCFGRSVIRQELIMSSNVLMEINREVCGAEVAAVRAAIASLSATPAKIDFYSVASASGVSRSTLYRNPVLREMVESARDSQLDPWAMVRALRDENSKLRARLQFADHADRRPTRGAVEYAFVWLSPAA